MRPPRPAPGATPAKPAPNSGAMVRRSLPPSYPMLVEDVLRPGDRGFLAAVLGPDMRAVSVGVDAVSGTAGLIWPGDRVDVVLTQQASDDNLPAYRRVAGETVLPDIRVIAIDQALVQGAMGDGPEVNKQVRTVTLEVTSKQAERVAVATRLGRLALVVRSATGAEPPAEAGSAITPAITWVARPAPRCGPAVAPPKPHPRPCRSSRAPQNARSSASDAHHRPSGAAAARARRGAGDAATPPRRAADAGRR